MYRKIQRVQKVLNEAALHTEKYGKLSKLSCPDKCDFCCRKKDISASPLEFLPLAYHLNKEGKADAFYNKLEQLPENDFCVLFSALNNGNGACLEYYSRGLICRLFGYSTNRDKTGQLRMLTCQSIKNTETYANLSPEKYRKAPVASEYYTKLAAIDFVLANEQLQINQAIKRALELVMTYYMYRNRRKRA